MFRPNLKNWNGAVQREEGIAQDNTANKKKNRKLGLFLLNVFFSAAVVVVALVLNTAHNHIPVLKVEVGRQRYL